MYIYICVYEAFRQKSASDPSRAMKKEEWRDDAVHKAFLLHDCLLSNQGIRGCSVGRLPREGVFLDIGSQR